MRVIILLLLMYNFVILNQIISTKARGSDYRSRKIGTLTRRISIIRRIRAKFFSIHVIIEKVLILGRALLGLINSLVGDFKIVYKRDRVLEMFVKYFSIDCFKKDFISFCFFFKASIPYS